jgi:hypothetical protein
MPTLQIDRPLDEILATNMPPGRPAGDEAETDESGHGSEGEEEGDETSPS